MKILYTEEEYKKAKTEEKLLLECYNCKKGFLKRKADIVAVFNQPSKKNKCRFCSQECLHKYRDSSIIVYCKKCNKEFKRNPSQISKNNFCSQTCSGIYTNANKKHGYRRSKLETWLEQELYNIYPQLEIHYNKKETIKAELDILIPSLYLAFELNGIFHYEPIYGNNQLEKIQNNDNRKIFACAEQGIGLCIIDTSSQKQFKKDCKKSLQYLEIITNLINQRLVELNIDLKSLPIIEKIIKPVEKVKKIRIPWRKVLNRPSKEELEKMVKEKHITEIAKDYKLTEGSIRKWCFYYEIDYKKLRPKVYGKNNTY